jgi:hypothetical protein
MRTVQQLTCLVIYVPGRYRIDLFALRTITYLDVTGDCLTHTCHLDSTALPLPDGLSSRPIQHLSALGSLLTKEALTPFMMLVARLVKIVQDDLYRTMQVGQDFGISL